MTAGASLLAVRHVLGTIKLMDVYVLGAPAALTAADATLVAPNVAKVVQVWVWRSVRSTGRRSAAGVHGHSTDVDCHVFDVQRHGERDLPVGEKNVWPKPV